jgi:hypothetical protein
MRVTTLQTPFLRVILVLLIALFAGASGPARADNPYAVAGISDPAHVTQFVARLKQAMTGDDRAAIEGIVNYPLSANSVAGRPTFLGGREKDKLITSVASPAASACDN